MGEEGAVPCPGKNLPKARPWLYSWGMYSEAFWLRWFAACGVEWNRETIARKVERWDALAVKMRSRNDSSVHWNDSRQLQLNLKPVQGWRRT